MILAAFSGLLTTLSGDYGDAAFVGWSALVLGVLAALAFAARARSEPVAAGLFALSVVIAFGALVGSIESWLGWFAFGAATDTPFSGFHPGNLLLWLVVVAAALVALRIFRFPLLALEAAVVAWIFLTDLLSNGGNWSATVTLLFGVMLMLVAPAVDRVYGFWLHVVAGLTIGGALLVYWHSSDTDWVLVAIASLVYIVVLAAKLGRSSYAVLGAFGLFLAVSHFVTQWSGVPSPIGVFFSDAQPKPWAQALSYAVFGLGLMVLGWWFARGRTPSDAPATTP